MDAWRIYSAAKRHKYLIILSVLVAAAGAVIVSLFLPKYYVATATLLPSEAVIRKSLQGPTDTPGTPPEVEVLPRDSRMANLIVLAKSRTIAERVARRVHVNPADLTRLVNVDRVYKAEGGVGTDLLAVTARAKDSNTAVGVANIWADEFIKFYEQVYRQEAVHSRQFLEDLLQKAHRQLNASEADLAAFQKQHSITDLPTEVDASFKELAPLRSERDDLRARVADIGARLAVRRVQLHELSPTLSVATREAPAATIDALHKSIADARAELTRLTPTYTDEYYRVKQLRQQISAAQTELARQQKHLEPSVRVIDDPSYQRVVSDIKDLEADAKAGQARLERLDTLIREREGKLGNYTGMDLQLADRRRVYDEAGKRYDSLSAQVHDARINERIAAAAGAIRFVDPAKNADGPLRAGPSVIQLILSAIVLGLIVGLSIVIAVETLDTRVRTATDAADLLELPVTGIIPSIPSTGTYRSSSALVTQTSPMSPFAESYRFLATEFLLDAPAREIKSIMVATAKPSQGGTSTICNLAITLSQAGRRVVLIDADFRRPSLHVTFGIPNDFGLADLLRNGSAVTDGLRPTNVENLAIITAGTNIDNPWALLRKAKMAQMIDDLKHIADYVLVDVPSAIVFADAATMASVVDGVLVVVRANESPRGSEFQIKGLLNKANANILGVVLNDVPPTDVDNCHYYAHYYATPSLLKPSPRRQTAAGGDDFVWTRQGSRADSDDGYALDEEGRP